MSKYYIGTNANGDRYAILKESVSAVFMARSGNTVVFTTGGKVSLGAVPEIVETLAEALMGGDEDEPV